MINEVGREVRITEGEPVSQERLRCVVNAPVSGYRRIVIEFFLLVHATGYQSLLLYDSRQLLQPSGWVWSMVKHPNRIASIEGSLSKWRVKNISLNNQHIMIISKVLTRRFHGHTHV